MNDTIFINDLMLPCIIGVFPHERKTKQIIYISIGLSVDLTKAGKSDNIHDTVSYHDIVQDVTKLVENSHYHLLEALAQAIADECLRDKRVKQVRVSIEKPKALPLARSSAVEIIRKNE